MKNAPLKKKMMEKNCKTRAENLKYGRLPGLLRITAPSSNRQGPTKTWGNPLVAMCQPFGSAHRERGIRTVIFRVKIMK